MKQRIMVVQTAGELAATVREALNEQTFAVKYVHGFDNARKNVIDTKPDLILIDIPNWANNVQELLSDFGNLWSTRSCRKSILASSAGAEDRALALESGADDFLLGNLCTSSVSTG